MKFSSYDVSNFIINYCENKGLEISNLKLNGILSFIHYNSKRVYGTHFVEDEPKRGEHFYIIEEAYERFRHMGAEPIVCLPSDFDFMTLLANDFDRDSVRRHSDEMLEGVNCVKSSIGAYIVMVLRELSRQDVFAITKTVDLEREAL